MRTNLEYLKDFVTILDGLSNDATKSPINFSLTAAHIAHVQSTLAGAILELERRLKKIETQGEH